MVDIICIFSQDGRIFLIHAMYGSASSFPCFSSRTIAPDNSESAQSSRAERKNEPRDNAFQSPTTLPSCRHKIKSLCYFYAQALFFM